MGINMLCQKAGIIILSAIQINSWTWLQDNIQISVLAIKMTLLFCFFNLEGRLHKNPLASLAFNYLKRLLMCFVCTHVCMYICEILLHRVIVKKSIQKKKRKEKKEGKATA